MSLARALVIASTAACIACAETHGSALDGGDVGPDLGRCEPLQALSCSECTWRDCRPDGTWSECHGGGVACDAWMPTFDAGPPATDAAITDASARDAPTLDAAGPVVTDASARDAPTLDAAGPCATSICGGGPCVLAVEEDLGATPLLNDMPSIALDSDGAPMVLVEGWDAGFTGRIMRRTPSGWTSTAMPVPVAGGSLALGGPGPLAAATEDGARHSALLIEGPSGLEVVAMPAMQYFASSSLWHDRSGVLHMVGNGIGVWQSPTYDTYDTTLHSTTIAPTDTRDTGGVIALDARGVPWIAWEDDTYSTGTHIRVWRGDTGVIESPPELLNLGVQSIAVRDVAGVSVPSIAARGPGFYLAVFTRSASGAWTRSVVIPTAEPCDFGCDTAHRFVLLPDGAALYILYSRTVLHAPVASAEIILADVDTPTTRQAVLSHDGAAIWGLRAVTDSCGRIHVAYQYAPSTAPDTMHSSARYALFGSR